MSGSEKHYKKMTETPVAKLIVTLGIPTTVSMLTNCVYNMVDTYFVGTLGESQQAATGILFTLQAILQALAFMLGQGSGTMVSKFLAERDEKTASEYVSTAFFTAFIGGLVLMAAGLVFLTPFMRLLGSTETILPYAKQYGMWVLLSAPFWISSFVLNNNLRYEGQSFYAMIGIMAGAILNIFGDYVLIRIYDMGVYGAGLSTATSQFVSFCVLFYMHRKMAQGKVRISSISKRVSVYATIGRVGFPALVRQGLSSISNGMLNNFAKAYGDAAIAAMSVVQRFSMLVMCVGLGVGQGFQPVASFNYQAKKYKRVKHGLLFTMKMGIVMVGVMAVFGLVFAEKIVYIFQKSEEVNRIGATALRYACIGSMFLPLSIPVNMLYQSIRKAAVSSVLSMMRSGLMFMPVLLVGTYFMGLTGVQIAQPMADTLTGLVSVPFVIHFMKKTPDED